MFMVLVNAVRGVGHEEEEMKRAIVVIAAPVLLWAVWAFSDRYTRPRWEQMQRRRVEEFITSPYYAEVKRVAEPFSADGSRGDEFDLLGGLSPSSCGAELGFVRRVHLSEGRLGYYCYAVGGAVLPIPPPPQVQP